MVDAFARHAPELCGQRQIYERGDAGSVPILFLHNFLKYLSVWVA